MPRCQGQAITLCSVADQYARVLIGKPSLYSRAISRVEGTHTEVKGYQAFPDEQERSVSTTSGEIAENDDPV